MEMASKACRITEFTGIKKLPVNIRWMPNIHWADATKMVCGRAKKTRTKRPDGTITNIGIFYAEGYGVPKDMNEARKWYEKAARQNDARAQCRLGYLIGGEDQEGDMEKAVYWIKKSAVQNDAEGQYYLGECYEFGTGIVQDINKACEYYEKAGTQGIAEAWTALGLIHAENATTGEDKEKARMYYQKAIAPGNIAAGTYLWALIKK